MTELEQIQLAFTIIFAIEIVVLWANPEILAAIAARPPITWLARLGDHMAHRFEQLTHLMERLAQILERIVTPRSKP